MKTPVWQRISAFATLITFAFSPLCLPTVLVDLDVTGAAAGPLASIPNSGSLGGTFDAEFDIPVVAEVDGVNAVTFDGSFDWYVGPDASAVSGAADRSVEAWVWNPDVPDEETIIAWGRRGGPDATNFSVNYGAHGTWGALGGWGGAADMPFQNTGAGSPPTSAWHHLVLTYDGNSNTRAIYVDGVLSNSEADGPFFNTHSVDDGTINVPALPLPFVLGNQNEPNGTRDDALSASMSMAKIKVHDTVLDAAAVAASYDADRVTFGLIGPTINSFVATPPIFSAGEDVTLSWDVVGADSITIDGVGDVTGQTSVVVSPVAATSYELNATNGEGTNSAVVNVGFAPDPNLIHQWTFDENGGAGTTLVDSIGGADGTIIDVGANDGSVALGKLTLTGGGKDQSDYVQLPGGLLSGLSDATIETWATQHSVQNWSRVFSVGNIETNVMLMSFTRAVDINLNEWRWRVEDGIAATQGNLTLQDFGGAPTNPIDAQVHWVVTVDDDGGPAGETHVTVYKDGQQVAADVTPLDLTNLDDQNLWLGRSRWPDNTANASWEEFRIYDTAMSPGQVEASYNAGPAIAPDIDGDGIPNSVEEMFAFLDPNNPDDADLDQDNDGSTNGEEYLAGTDMEDEDTDDDNALDGSEAVAMTDPLDPDSDDDGLLDGDELTLTTNPLLADTDGDRIGDGLEVDSGSDPLDPNSIPSADFPEIAHRWAFEEEGVQGTVLVDSVGGADGTIVDGGLNEGTVGGGAVSLAGGAQGDSDYVELPGGLLSGREDVTVETWVTQNNIQNWSRVFSVGNENTNVMHMSFTRAVDGATNEIRWRVEDGLAPNQGNLTIQDFGLPTPNPLTERVHWVVTIDDDGGAGGETQLKVYKDGKEVSSGDTLLDLSDLDDRDLWLGRSRWPDDTAAATWDEFRIYDGVLDPVAVAVSGALGPDRPPAGPAAPEIVDVVYDSGSQTIDVTWTSRPGLTYVIETSSNGEDWGDVEDGHPSGGDLTTYTGIDASGERLLIRIRENEGG